MLIKSAYRSAFQRLAFEMIEIDEVMDTSRLRLKMVKEWDIRGGSWEPDKKNRIKRDRP